MAHGPELQQQPDLVGSESAAQSGEPVSENMPEHRVDPSHPMPAIRSVASESCHETTPSPEQWLELQSIDLVTRLQAWASDLDAREAQLNARASLQDHRERRWRLRQQGLEIELAERQRSIERLRGEIEAHARRLAFLDDSVAQ